MTAKTCCICRAAASAETPEAPSGGIYALSRVTCGTCGIYHLNNAAIPKIAELPDYAKRNLSEMARERSDRSQPLLINEAAVLRSRHPRK